MRIALRLGLLLGVLAAAAPAAGVAVSPDPLVFDLRPGLGYVGQVDFLGSTSGLPSGGVVLAGTVDPSDTTLLFSISADAAGDAIPNLSLISFGGNVETAIGTVPGAGVDVVSGTLTWPDVTFDGPGVGPGQTSDAIFVAYSTLLPGSEISMELFGALVILGAVTVPEPALAGLLGSAGLLALASVARRARAQR